MSPMRLLALSSGLMLLQACHAAVPTPRSDAKASVGHDTICLAYHAGYGLTTSSLWCADGICTSVEAVPPQPGAFRAAVRSGPVASRRIEAGQLLVQHSLTTDRVPADPSFPSLLVRRGRDRIARDFASATSNRSSTDSLAQWFREIRNDLKPTTWSDSLTLELRPNGKLRYRLESATVTKGYFGQNPTLISYYAERMASGDPPGHPTWTKSDTASTTCLDDLFAGRFCEMAIPAKATWSRAQLDGSASPASPIPDGACFQGRFEIGTDWIELRK